MTSAVIISSKVLLNSKCGIAGFQGWSGTTWEFSFVLPCFFSPQQCNGRADGALVYFCSIKSHCCPFTSHSHHNLVLLALYAKGEVFPGGEEGVDSWLWR